MNTDPNNTRSNIYIPIRKPNKKFQLFCFPHAGGSVYWFREWAAMLHQDIELAVIILPGHDARLVEKPLDNWGELIAEAFFILQSVQEKPYALFGHSFGARICYELTKFIQKNSHELPQHIFLSACRSPDTFALMPHLHSLPPEDFRNALMRINGIPEEIMLGDTFTRYFENTIRTDMALSEYWGGLSPNPHNHVIINSPITALSGISDHLDPPIKMKNWQYFTSSSFRMIEFEGGHFFIDHHLENILSIICKSLNAELIRS